MSICGKGDAVYSGNGASRRFWPSMAADAQSVSDCTALALELRVSTPRRTPTDTRGGASVVDGGVGEVVEELKIVLVVRVVVLVVVVDDVDEVDDEVDDEADDDDDDDDVDEVESVLGAVGSGLDEPSSNRHEGKPLSNDDDDDDDLRQSDTRPKTKLMAVCSWMRSARPCDSDSVNSSLISAVMVGRVAVGCVGPWNWDCTVACSMHVDSMRITTIIIFVIFIINTNDVVVVVLALITRTHANQKTLLVGCCGWWWCCLLRARRMLARRTTTR